MGIRIKGNLEENKAAENFNSFEGFEDDKKSLEKSEADKISQKMSKALENNSEIKIDDKKTISEIEKELKELKEKEISEYLKNFDQKNWENLDYNQKAECIKNFKEMNLKYLNVQENIKTGYFNSYPEYRGYYENSNKMICFNVNALDNGKDVAHTIAHECRHAWQHEYAENSDTDLAQMFKENIDNYIKAEDDYFGYKDQFIEANAEEHAEYIMSLGEEVADSGSDSSNTSIESDEGYNLDNNTNIFADENSGSDVDDTSYDGFDGNVGNDVTETTESNSRIDLDSNTNISEGGNFGDIE